MDNPRQLTRRTSRGPFFSVAFRSPEMATSKPPGYRPPAGHPAGLGHLTVNSTQVTNRAPGAEGTSRRKNTHCTDRGLRVPFADKTRRCPLAFSRPQLKPRGWPNPLRPKAQWAPGTQQRAGCFLCFFWGGWVAIVSIQKAGFSPPPTVH